MCQTFILKYVWHISENRCVTKLGGGVGGRGEEANTGTTKSRGGGGVKGWRVDWGRKFLAFFAKLGRIWETNRHGTQNPPTYYSVA